MICAAKENLGRSSGTTRGSSMDDVSYDEFELELGAEVLSMLAPWRELPIQIRLCAVLCLPDVRMRLRLCRPLAKYHGRGEVRVEGNSLHMPRACLLHLLSSEGGM